MLTDFGLAKGRAYTVLTRPGQVMGTLDYLAPELIRGKPATPATDIYALGCVAFECVAGQAPFADKSRLPGRARASRRSRRPIPCAGRPELPAALLCRDPGRAREGSRTTTCNGRCVREPAARRLRGGDSRMTPALVFKEGPLAGQRVEVDVELVLGREDAGLTIEDEEISRRHAVIRPGDGGSRDRGPRLDERDVRERGADRGRDPARRRRHGQARPERAPGRVGSRSRHRRVGSARAPLRRPRPRLRPPPACRAAARSAPAAAFGTYVAPTAGKRSRGIASRPARAPARLVRDGRRHRRGARPLLRRACCTV